MPRADRRCIVAQRGDGQARLAQYADREPRATLDSDGQVTLAFAAAGEKNCAYCISSRYAPCAVALPGSASHGDDLRCSQERGAAVALSRQGGPAFKAPPENHCVIRAICELHPHQDAPRLAGIVLHASFAGQRCSVVSGAEAEQRRSVKVQSCRAHRAVMDELKHAARKRSPVASVLDTRKRWIRARDAGMPMRAICTGSPNHDITHMLRRRCAQHKLS